MDKFSVKKSFESGKGFIPVLILVVAALIIGVVVLTMNRTPATQMMNTNSTEVASTAPTVVGDVMLMLDPATVSTTLNQTVKVAVNIDTKTETVSAVELHITYDPTFLTASSVDNGTFLPVILQPGKMAEGKVSIVVGSNPTTPKKGTGTVATVTLKAIKAGSTMVTIDNASQVASVGKNANTLGSTTGTSVTIK